MDSQIPSPISVIDPVSKAVEKTREILFSPFDLKKWCIIGFCAWLAFLGERGGGGNSGFHGGGGRGDGGHHGAEVKAWIMANLYWIIPTAVFLFFIITLFSILFCWLRSRGKFMFLHCVALNRAEITPPWKTYADQGNSLFLFTLAVGLTSFVCILPFIALLVFSVIMTAKAKMIALGIPLITIAVLSILLLSLSFGIIFRFTEDFVVPIMALRHGRVLEAWKEFLALLNSHKGKFILYLLFRFLIGIVIGGICSILILMTCCFCFTFLIPLAGSYIATVVLLPFLTFERSYSLSYLAQYGTAYDVFAAAGAAPEGPETEGFMGGNGI